jgi:gliding motility-associated lipoprotein GldH
MKPGQLSNIFTILLMLLFSACREDSLYHEFRPLTQWNRAEVLCFEDSLVFTSGKAEQVEIVIQLRNDNSYPYANLCLNADIFLPDSVYREFIDIKLTKEDGKWAGPGWGSLFTHEVILKSLPITDKFKIELSHAMQDEVLEGIRSVGVCLRLR